MEREKLNNIENPGTRDTRDGSVSDWVRQMAGATLVLSTPEGVVHCVSSPAAHARLLSRGEVAFAPLELVELLRIPESLVAAVTRVKRLLDPEARVVPLGSADAPAGRVRSEGGARRAPARAKPPASSSPASRPQPKQLRFI